MNAYIQRRRREDPAFRLRRGISTTIGRAIARRGGYKADSFLKAIGYTMQELKEHLESQFEPWMNWDNQGYYVLKTWDDDDPTTWRWQLDHIIPQSLLPYTSMSEDNFKKCWYLDNLRPLSAKQNCLDGNRRVRHTLPEKL